MGGALAVLAGEAAAAAAAAAAAGFSSTASDTDSMTTLLSSTVCSTLTCFGAAIAFGSAAYGSLPALVVTLGQPHVCNIATAGDV